MFQWYKHYADTILSLLPRNRLLALDVFRGVTIAAMILVNNPGSWSYVYAPLLHAKWHGYTPTDLIFPFFVFIVGISISIVMERELKKGTDRVSIVKSAAVRAGKLFALGLFLAIFYYDFTQVNYSWLQQELYQIRVLGVLQRLGIVFFVTMLIVLFFSNFGRWLWLISLLIGYWLALIFIPYSVPTGETFQGLLLHGNSLVAWFDSLVLAPQHLYYSSAQPLPFDPEGLLSTLPAIASCLTGVFTGSLLLSDKLELQQKVKKLFVYGVGLIFVGHLWDLLLPINKALWTSSYVVVTTGWALFSLALLTWLIDMRNIKRWSAPFIVFGANAIFFYMFSGVVARLLIMFQVGEVSIQGWTYFHILQPWLGYYNGSLAFALLFLFFSYFVMHSLYKKQIIFKV